MVAEAQRVSLIEVAATMTVGERAIEKFATFALGMIIMGTTTSGAGNDRMMLGVVELDHRERLGLFLLAAGTEIEVRPSRAFEASAHDGKVGALIASNMLVNECRLFLEAYWRGGSSMAVQHLIHKLITVRSLTRSDDLHHGVWLH